MDGSRPLWDASPGATAPLEDRFDFLFNLMQHAGFGSVDNLLETWYTGDFDDASPLRQEQRLSRHRGLTALLARLRDATDGWSKWERWGYREETLLGAESILQAEFAKLTQGQGQLSQHVAGLGRDRVEATKGLKRCLQREVGLSRIHEVVKTLLTMISIVVTAAAHIADGPQRRIG